ncbi:fibronectin type III domain-containing protein [Candidatus Poriferisodalis sp.]|uniref:fibronectin type III domain-containing protein n=1 Tax=Candidatus Poriferisodalis sp. TaxID=3101277 RepID=UPI003B02C720
MKDSSVVSEGAGPASPNPARRRGRPGPVRWLCALAALVLCAGAAVVAAVPAGAGTTTMRTYELFFRSGSVAAEGLVFEVGLRVSPPMPDAPPPDDPMDPPLVETTVFNASTHHVSTNNSDLVSGTFPLQGWDALNAGDTSREQILPLIIHADRLFEGDEVFEVRVGPPTGPGLDASLFRPVRAGADRLRVTIKDTTITPVFSSNSYSVTEGDTLTGSVRSTGLRSKIYDLPPPLAEASMGDNLNLLSLVARNGSARAGTDFTAPPASLFKKITPANLGDYGVRRFSIATIDDSVCQPTRSFTVAVADPGRTNSAVFDSRSTATVYISEPADTTDAPPAPPIYGMDHVSATEMTVRWGSAICADAYQLAYKPTSTTTWTTLASGASDSKYSHTVRGLTADTAYHVRVRAKNGTVNSAWTTMTYTPPTAGKLTGLTLDDGTNDLVLLPVEANADGFQGDRPELRYAVKVAPGTRSVRFTPTWLDANISRVAGTTANYTNNRLIATNAVSTSGSQSNHIKIAGSDAYSVPISGPVKMQIQVDSSSTYNLLITPDETWASADNYLQRIVLLGSGAQSSPANQQIAHSVPQRRASDVLTLSARSSVHAVSDTFGGHSAAASGGVSAVTMDASPGADASAGGDSGDATAQLDGSGGSGSVRIDLSEPFDDEQHGYTATVPNDVTSVTVDASPAHAEATVTVNGNTPDTPVQLEVGANRVSIEVTAENGYQRTYTVTITRQPLPPGEIDPDGLQTNAKRRRITVAWDAPDSGGAPDGYIVHIRPQGGKQGSGATKRVDADRTSVTFKRLEPGTVYKIWVRAHNSAGKGDRTRTTAATAD